MNLQSSSSEQIPDIFLHCLAGPVRQRNDMHVKLSYAVASSTVAQREYSQTNGSMKWELSNPGFS